MTQALGVREDTTITPAMFSQSLELAAEKAKILKTLVDSQNLFVKIGGNKHLRVEAWETIGQGYGLSTSSHISELVKDADGKVIGVIAHADVLNRDGVIVGGADSTCFSDEDGKASQTVSQLAGMAQTRAVSRALKQVLSWVVVLAGYSATPAEEMHGQLRKDMDAATNETFHCEEHSTSWFRKGKMKNHAHPIGDTGQWCNMPALAVENVQEGEPRETPKRAAIRLIKDMDMIDPEAFDAWAAVHCRGVEGLPTIEWNDEQWVAVRDALIATNEGAV